MAKYIAFKIFDEKDYNDFAKIKQKQLDKFYTIVHEDYFEGVIKANLEEST